MKNRRILGFVGIATVAIALLACDAGNIVALISPATETPTRAPRPTFTPRPSDTPTPEDTATPEATDTPAASPTATKRAATVVRSPTPKPAPTQPPAPQYLFKVKNNDGSHGKCEQGGVFQVKGRIADSQDYVAGVHVVLQGADGSIVAQGDSWGRISMNPEWGVSCFESKNNYNYQLDATAGRSNEPMKLFLSRSATDLAPISPPQSITFGTGGRWYVDFYQ